MERTFERADAKRFRDRLEVLLEPLKKEFGCGEIYVGTITYGGVLRTRVELRSGGAAVMSKAELGVVHFERHAVLFGVPASAFGRVVNIRGRSFKLVDIIPSRRKYPFVGESITGSGARYKLPVNEVVAACKNLK